MNLPPEANDRPVEASLKTTYRALLARGLESGEAANLTAFLHGLPSADFHWTLPEIEAIVRRRLEHAAEQRAATLAALLPRTEPLPNLTTATPRRPRRSGMHRPGDGGRPRLRATRVSDPPTA